MAHGQRAWSTHRAGDEAPSSHAVLYCERFVEWLIDVLSQLPTRRLVHAVLLDSAVLVKAKLSPLYKHPSGAHASVDADKRAHVARSHTISNDPHLISPPGRLFVQLVDLLEFYLDFPINDHSGDALNEEDVTADHYERLQQVQRLLFKHWPQLHEVALMNCATLQAPATLRKWFGALPADDLKQLVTKQLRYACMEGMCSTRAWVGTCIPCYPCCHVLRV